MAPQSARRYLSLDETADYLGVSTRTVRRLISAGQITGYRLGERTVRVDRADADAALRVIPTAGGAA